MHNLVIDIGNTNSKLAVFKGKTLVDYQVLKQIVPADLLKLIKAYPILHATLSSVGEDLEEVVSILKSNTNYIPFSTAINTGIKNNYKSLSTLGLDRWAKVIAANTCYKGKNCLMI